MMQIDLVNRLLADAGVSSFAGTRIYPIILPQNPLYPAITYSIEDETFGETFDEATTDYVETQVQVDAWGNTYAEAKNLYLAIKASLANFTGMMGSTKVYRLRFESSVEVYESAVKAYRISSIFLITHKE
jgi:hypothetical protein